MALQGFAVDSALVLPNGKEIWLRTSLMARSLAHARRRARELAYAAAKLRPDDATYCDGPVIDLPGLQRDRAPVILAS